MSTLKVNLALLLTIPEDRQEEIQSYHYATRKTQDESTDSLKLC